MTHSRRQEIMRSPEWKELVEVTRREFREKFGREQGPDDPFFFDPDADTPQPLTEETAKRHLVEAATSAGVHPRIIYAMNKTGLIVTEDAYHRLSECKRREWDDACAEYDEKVAWLRPAKGRNDRLELFARERPPAHWDFWGNEVSLN